MLSFFFLTLTEGFPCFFLSFKANVRVKLVKTGHGPHSSTLVVICVVRLLFVCCLCVNVYCHRMTTPLQLTYHIISYHITSYHIIHFVVCNSHSCVSTPCAAVHTLGTACDKKEKEWVVC